MPPSPIVHQNTQKKKEFVKAQPEKDGLDGPERFDYYTGNLQPDIQHKLASVFIQCALPASIFIIFLLLLDWVIGLFAPDWVPFGHTSCFNDFRNDIYWVNKRRLWKVCAGCVCLCFLCMYIHWER
jgi:hypothetical protein